jgi:hypothetical protein
VAADAVLPDERHHVAPEIDPAIGFSEQRSGGKTGDDGGGSEMFQYQFLLWTTTTGPGKKNSRILHGREARRKGGGHELGAAGAKFYRAQRSQAALIP